ncbi:cytochrome o ubiquinol oxidase subunit III [Martelella lutilitoris]|uniref:Cytochrome bo(3) ubiquinol oxidase subunit 3 n=1 Tax=Martelella lutilitoris TaxID=2583532 RepID=A0A5C4JVW8_9HYPH|nr:cytochrome o ubiquinol oxidase subunit III [Martelella lutilitoris]TNB49603.1 cytochrome o ubiquinol oxidase subunit III [Martelella lutilitoris]
MTIADQTGDTHHDEHAHHSSPTQLGFWIYLMSDCLIFGTLFATYAVLGRSYAGGPSPADLFELDFALIETALLLFSSVTFGMGMLRMDKGDKAGLMKWLIVAGLFAIGFLAMEIYEFHHFIELGATPDRSAFLSAYFTLVGTHGLHVTFGTIWLIVLLVQLSRKGLTESTRRRTATLSMFWHFLDLVWIGVFSLVYLTGVVL